MSLVEARPNTEYTTTLLTRPGLISYARRVRSAHDDGHVTLGGTKVSSRPPIRVLHKSLYGFAFAAEEAAHGEGFQ